MKRQQIGKMKRKQRILNQDRLKQRRKQMKQRILNQDRLEQKWTEKIGVELVTCELEHKNRRMKSMEWNTKCRGCRVDRKCRPNKKKKSTKRQAMRAIDLGASTA